MAESLGSSNTAQVIDLFPNNASEYTPAYGIYENGKIARVALFNYMTDSSGAHDYTATISVGGNGETNAMPSSVKVKYLQAASVAQKANITWAGQVGHSLISPEVHFADFLFVRHLGPTSPQMAVFKVRRTFRPSTAIQTPTPARSKFPPPALL